MIGYITLGDSGMSIKYIYNYLFYDNIHGVIMNNRNNSQDLINIVSTISKCYKTAFHRATDFHATILPDTSI